MSKSATGQEIRLDKLTKRYSNTQKAAVSEFSLTIPAGEIVVFVGPSGCGKTTTMKMINRIIEPTSGRIFIGGNDVTETPAHELRRNIGYVIQQIGLFPHLTIADNVATVPQLLGWEKSRTRTRVNELLELVGLDPSEYAGRYPKQLSGGQQQRVGVARALAADPAVLLMDEPFGATDPITRVRLQKEFRALQRELKKTIVFVTHDFEEALLLGDRIAVLSEQSQVEQYGTPLEILSAPATKGVESFVGEAASVRMLGLVSLSAVDLQPGTVAGPTLSETATLREAMEQFITGSSAINVGTVGHLTFSALQSAISDTRAKAK
ncbi:MAG: ABC transporter ATP-binding protein [Actinobacteria bacterium]|nr:ABC transporter ATP-binding protein [Actinomycetota bacterium]